MVAFVTVNAISNNILNTNAVKKTWMVANRVVGAVVVYRTGMRVLRGSKYGYRFFIVRANYGLD